MCIETSSLPSNNLQYDYFTAIAEISSGTAITGTNLTIGFNSAHTNRTDAHIKGAYSTQINQPIYTSVPLSNYATDIGYTTSNTYYPRFDILLNVPQSTTATTYTVKLLDFGMTTYVNSIGSKVVKGTTQTVSQGKGNIELNAFDPSWTWKEVNSNGYSAAISQELQNVTTQQSEISGNPHYVEQVTYEGDYELPSAPDLSYGPTHITEQFITPTNQTTVFDINGQSLLNVISGKNGTISLMTVSPTQKNTLIQIVEYTSSQWTAVSGPPGFFSVNGILYYFDEIVLGIIAVVGLAGGAAVARTRSLRRVK